MQKSIKDVVVTVLGIIALSAFAVLIFHLLGRATKAEELEWTRLVYLLTGVEAIAFAAAGYFFGREVNRERAESAEKRADEAQTNASDARVEVTKARQQEAGMKANLESVRAAIRGHKQARGTGAGLHQALDAQQASEIELDTLEAMVDNLLASPRT